MSADVLDDPDFKALIHSQVDDVVAAGQAKFDTDKEPTNELFREGEYKPKDGKDSIPFERVTFKMKGSRKTRGGVEIPQSPRLFDAKRRPMSDEIWGGTKMKISYYLQYSITPTGTFITLKLDSVQVMELVGPTGEVAADKMFDEEEGFETADVVDDGPGPCDPPPPNAGDLAVEVPRAASDF